MQHRTNETLFPVFAQINSVLMKYDHLERSQESLNIIMHKACYLPVIITQQLKRRNVFRNRDLLHLFLLLPPLHPAVPKLPRAFQVVTQTPGTFRQNNPAFMIGLITFHIIHRFQSPAVQRTCFLDAIIQHLHKTIIILDRGNSLWFHVNVRGLFNRGTLVIRCYCFNLQVVFLVQNHSNNK
ncbi:unnamed protein product [Absidia cylindrospora]